MKTLVKNGRIIDPYNGIDEKLDILIQDGIVKELGKNLDHSSEEEMLIIDAEGKVISPGFIDIHMHEDPVVDGKIYDDDKGIFSCMLRMGVTTCLAGNCGDNVYNPGEYLDLVDRDGAPVNVAMLAGHGFLRREAGCMDKYANATKEEKERLYSLVREALEGGCYGASFGIRYIPGTERDEVLEIAKLCKERDRLISSHIRSDAGEVFDALDEFLGVAKEAGASAQVSHIGSMAGFGQMKDFLKRVEEYRDEGLDVFCDCYPYYAFSTSIGATTYDDGWMERYESGYDVIEMCEGKYKGMRLTRESFDEMRKEHPDYLTVCYVMKEEDVNMAIRHPLVMVASDGILSEGQGHPRAAGTFPRLLGTFVREGIIDLYEGIEKITAMPKRRLKLEKRGSLGLGDIGDMVIFDPEEIMDKATFQSPILSPLGIDYVLIGGEIAVKNGKILDKTLGRSIRK